ncbi:MAG: hypothetical protein AB7O96_17350, partial [Pseudobdellovibrionaceae bacterium]
LTGNKSSEAWELENHTCKDFTGEEKKSCESWWGHCNGWAAAAIKEVEPRKGFKVGNINLSVADAKGILSEVWLSTNSLGAGNTDKSVKTKDGLKEGWIADPQDATYKTFWDTTPRAFFMITTNYIGINKMGFAIDRFTGDEVWNQPIVGYRILPIRENEIRQENRYGKKVWAVPMAMKLYWANDLGTPPGAISEEFDIKKHSKDNDQLEDSLPGTTDGDQAYEARMLEFTLFFNSEVKVSADGKKVLAAGKMVGDGIWKMQEDPKQYNHQQLDEGHPDFVWLPTNAILDDNGYANPFMVKSAVGLVEKGNKKASGSSNSRNEDEAESEQEPEEKPTAVASYKITFSMKAFENLKDVNPESVKRKIKRVLARAEAKGSIPSDSIEILQTRVKVVLDMTEGMSNASLKALFKDADMGIIALDAAN